MRKDPGAPAPIFVDGVPVEPEAELRRWIAERVGQRPRALLRLPFTFFAGRATPAALGLAASPDGAWLHRLDDAALGVSLADRLRRLRGDAPPAAPLAVWLSVRMGSLLPGAPSDAPVASVFAVHEAIAPGVAASALVAQAERAPADLAVVLQRSGHCARGSRRCARCREAEAEPATPALLDLCPDDPQAARPTVGVTRNGATTWSVYDVLRRFASPDEARDFATRHGITDARLDAPDDS